MFTKLCRIGNDPQLRYTQSGTAALNLSLAYNYGQKGEDGKKPTQWLEAIMWGKQAEALQPYLAKGDQVVVSVDDLHVETYDRKDGGTGVKLTGRVVGFDFANAKRDGTAQQQQPAPQQQPQQQQPQRSTAPASVGDAFDDDILF